ncbi:YidC/Oxa1 family membrane protein insertase [Lachnospiraceae bacterium XBB1006]|nr:YidC/Oxa1 family membrane protein insertase [Lachnospiraceae bacterium XBB1006]
MISILLTQDDGKILGPIAKIIGFFINYIYIGLSHIGIENIGVTIILFTIFVYMILFPLTYKQQKFSKLNSKMSPELQKIQKKYEGKRDQASALKMREETQAVYDKYGVSPTGSCLPIFIQFPIMIAVYRVVMNVPAYVPSIKSVYTNVVTKVMSVSGYDTTLTKLVEELGIKRLKLHFDGTHSQAANSVIDIIYKFSENGWVSFKKAFPAFSDSITALQKSLHGLNNFLGLDISWSPFESIKLYMSNGRILLVFFALLLPILSGLTQWLSMKLSMSAQGDAMKDNPAMQQMKAMNMFMPLFSVVLVFTSPIGLGIYWTAGAVVRSVQQFFLNKHFDKMDFDKIIEDNREKAEAKRAKREGYMQNAISQNGKLKTKNITSPEEIEKELSRTEELKRNAKPGSMASKANLVNDYNKRNN